MSVLVFADQHDGSIKKIALEALAFGRRLQAGEVIALVLGSCTESSLKTLARSGADKIWHATDSRLDSFDAAVAASAIRQAAESTQARYLIVPNNYHGKAVGPLLSVALKAGFVSGVSALPEPGSPDCWKKSVFSGKATARVRVLTERVVVSLNPNSLPVETREQEAVLESWKPELPVSRIRVLETKALDGDVPLTEAAIVVSGGRGLKGPENWTMIEDLAHEMKAATACSRPVADAGWRPHHEHVGQTGISIRPQLYIAIGISGAIQHLAGVSGSRYMVVINKDPEAPFFKAADYGIVGDAFEVVPKLIQALKDYRAAGK